MLVLSRKTEEDILIGDSVVVKIIEIRGDKVRIGIEVPKDVPVHRREIAEAIARDGKKKI
jgi:carbon storage regulator